MNQKIKELAEQSGVVEPHVDWEAAGGVLLEKFAELIIKDVLSEVWDEVQYSTSQSIANEIDEKLKTYYGFKNDTNIL